MKQSLLYKVFVSVFCSATVVAFAQIKPDINADNPTPQEQKARKIYERLTGTKLPADSPVIKQMTSLIEGGNSIAAAQLATSDPNFYNITVKLMALELSSREETIKTPFNDFAAAFIGVTRDKTDARELLTGNFYYRGRVPAAFTVEALIKDILISNNHYAALERSRIDLSANLERVEGQVISTSETATQPNPDPAGVLTLRSFMGSHALMGTNRRLVEYTFREFMCTPMSEMADTGAPDSHIGRDIDRFPAGDHLKFLTSCKGCHTVMDGFRGAFARWDYDGAGIKHATTNTHGNGRDFTIKADAQNVVSKMNSNMGVFPSGFITTNDSFVNNAIRTENSKIFQWRGTVVSGNGVNAFGKMVSNSKRFSQCMVKRVYNTVCRKNIDFSKQNALIAKWGDDFENSGYKLKTLFESVATKPECL